MIMNTSENFEEILKKFFLEELESIKNELDCFF